MRFVLPSRLYGGLSKGTLSLALAWAAGCTSLPPAAPTPPSEPNADAQSVPVVRQGRYTLVELTPEPGQRDLLEQIVDVSIPPDLGSNVGDAMRYVLLHSGYRLCTTPQAAPLNALPLPASQMHLGPLTLRDALLSLAGPAWTLSVDEGNRLICFNRSPVPAGSEPAPHALDGASSPAAVPYAPSSASDAPLPWEQEP
ncbi:PFGI-1 class ICE element type IV pilus protein PilL2 [Ralstonia pseudosolanacearum]|uniref:PFGI-1 class ICE element type IV pilus protein PilL2 n=1 Tax=Ralstonia pseudosolanacearum TaxID=1310165 RepID=UPI0040540AB4